jgi:dTDP-4-amino-4,6-dideoxygalactose transaminase
VIPIYRPWLGEEEAEATQRPIRSGWITQGPEVAAFEAEFADFVGAEHAVAVANCTVALQLALILAGVGPGHEVITVSHSYIATANSIRYVGALPVFADIEADTFNLDPNQLDGLVSERTRAVLAVHQIGMPCDLGRILPWARERQLVVIEDAACAAGSQICWDGDWQSVGKPHGDVACFSFHPRKLLTTGDGGMLTLARADWAERARRLRQHSMSVPDTVRHASPQLIQESYPELGYNFRLTDIQAAVGRVQLSRLPRLLERRRQQVDWYRRRLASLPLAWQRQPAWARSNWQSLAVRLPEGQSQRKWMQQLLDDGISTRRGIMCAHREAAYPPASWRGGSLLQSEKAQDEVILLPLFHDLSEEQRERVAEGLEKCCR